MRIADCFACRKFHPVILMKRIDKHKHFYMCVECQKEIKNE